MIKSIVTNIKDLKKSSSPVEPNENIKELLKDLKDTCIANNGFGLTAIQIGIPKKISYIRLPKHIDPKTKQIEYKEFYIINAKITDKDTPVKIQNESCLSFKGLSVTTKRYAFIAIQFENEKRELQTGIMQDLEAITVQHEYDHQNGYTIFNRKWRAK